MSQDVDYIGSILCANPNNPTDGLNNSTILIVSQTPQLSVGIQLNRPLEALTLANVAANLDIWYGGTDYVYYGGNVGTSKIHVVHSSEWAGLTTVKLTDEISVTSDLSVINSLANGTGPEYFRACAGFWIWDENHLELQMDPHSGDHVRHRWEVAPATRVNIFELEGEKQWLHCLKQAALEQINSWF